MKCCPNCFSDSEIKSIIRGPSNKSNPCIGRCDFCKSENVALYDIDVQTDLSEMLNGLVDNFRLASELPEGFPKDKVGFLGDLLTTDWKIFDKKLGPEITINLLNNICSDRFKYSPELFSELVGIPEMGDDSFKLKNSLLKNSEWDDFLDSIKTRLRFHSDHVNEDILFNFLKYTEYKLPEGSVFYRSRLWKDGHGFGKNELGAPPVRRAGAGRVNPEGISVLYLSDDIKTTLYEIRARLYDCVSVGKFIAQRDLELINLTLLDEISPFSLNMDYLVYAVNINHLRKISEEISTPVRNENTLDYLPTQYISDYIKSCGYDGIVYRSAMQHDSLNLAIFNESSFVCKSVSNYEVNSLNYSYKRL